MKINKRIIPVEETTKVYDLCGLTIQELACIKGALEHHGKTGGRLYLLIDQVEGALMAYPEYFGEES